MLNNDDIKIQDVLVPGNTLYSGETLQPQPNSTLVQVGGSFEDGKEMNNVWLWGSGIANIKPLPKIAEEARTGKLLPLTDEEGNAHNGIYKQCLLHSQFRPFAILIDAGEQRWFVLAEMSDIEEVRRCPVILASYLQMAGSIHKSDRIYPPREHGTIGMVSSNGKIASYSISNLPVASQRLQERIALRLDELEKQPQDHTVPLFSRDEEVRALIQKLAMDYHEHHQTLHNRPLPDIADVFHKDMAQVFYALPFQAFSYAAISRKASKPENGVWPETSGDWRRVSGQKENDLIVSYSFQKIRRGKIDVQIQEDATGKVREHVLASMWEQSVQYSDLDSDVYLARLVQLINGAKDAQGNTWITAQQILSYRGILPKKNRGDKDDHYTGGQRWEDLEKIAACIARERNVTIKIAEMEIIDGSTEDSKKRKRGRQIISRESPLFMEGDIIYHKTLPIDGPSRSIAIAWQYRESSWMLPFLTGPNSFPGELVKKVLNYDPHNEQWEKRISKYFMWWLRANAKNQKKPGIYIGNLLQELNLDINERFPQRTRDRFEKAMNKIASDGLLLWEYKDMEELPAHKWLPTWLRWRIDVKDHPSLNTLHTNIATSVKAIKAKNDAKRPQKPHQATENGGNRGAKTRRTSERNKTDE